jgi:hypothetical protein
MDVSGILEELHEEMTKLREAIAALERLDTGKGKRRKSSQDWIREMQEQGELVPIRFQDL